MLNFREKANFIWLVADLLRGNYSQADYGKDDTFVLDFANDRETIMAALMKPPTPTCCMT